MTATLPTNIPPLCSWCPGHSAARKQRMPPELVLIWCFLGKDEVCVLHFSKQMPVLFGWGAAQYKVARVRIIAGW